MRKLLYILIVLLGFHFVLVLTDSAYVYKVLQHTVFKGRLSPTIDDWKKFPYRIISKSNEPAKWPYSKTQFQLPDSSIAFLEKYDPNAFLIIQNDSIRFEKYWESGGDTAKTNSFSMAKTIVSILTGIAIDEGKIKNVDQPIGNFLPEYKEDKRAQITFRHLLTMSSGIGFNESYINPFAYPSAAYYGDDLVKTTLKFDPVEPPGKVFDYQSGNTSILGFALAKATGKSLSKYAEEKLWQPLGMETDATWSLDKENGVEKSYCCINSTARDFARFGQLFLDSGKWNGQEIISYDFVKASIAPAPLVTKDGGKNHQYGYSWWLMNYKGHNIFYERGILGQYIIIVPEKRLVIVRLGKKRDKEKINDHPVDVYRYINIALSVAK